MRPVNTVKFTLTDGKEREFLLTMGGLRRLRKKFDIKGLRDLWTTNEEDAVVPILYEALQDKGDLTEEAFADLLPSHIEALGEVVGALLGASFPDKKQNPTPPAPTIQ